MTAREYALQEIEGGYGVALIDRESEYILTPYFPSWHDEDCFPQITNWEVNFLGGGDSFYLGLHSGCLEEEWREQGRGTGQLNLFGEIA